MVRTVTLVTESNKPIGECPILEAHASPGKLHRAFSAYVFSTDGKELLLQKRHEGKLFGGMWANTCCSHPFEGEDIVVAGERRIKEELGITCSLTQVGALTYQADDPSGKGSEHEFDVLLKGSIDRGTEVRADAREVAEWKWIDLESLREDMKKNPDIYAPWFHLGLPRVLESY